MPGRAEPGVRRTKAHDLKRALDIFDPEWPLKTEEDLAEFFVERAQSPLEELQLILRNTTTPQYTQITSSFPDTCVMPNFKVAHRDGGPDEAGLEALQEILLRRADERLLTPEGLRTLAELSGGLPRGLIALARRACLVALAESKETIDKGVAESAADRVRLDCQVLLTSEQLGLLKTVAQTRRVENDDKHRALLHNLSVLEYRNDTGLWYDVHPIVRPLLAGEG